MSQFGNKNNTRGEEVSAHHLQLQLHDWESHSQRVIRSNEIYGHSLLYSCCTMTYRVRNCIWGSK